MIRALMQRRNARGAGPPIPFVAEGYNFGPGASNQAPHDVLLQESLGIADASTRAIAARISSLEPQVVIDTEITDGTIQTEILDDYPLKKLIDNPHPNISRRQLLRITAQWIVSVGEAYWLKVDSGFRVPTRLQWYPPSLVTPILEGGEVTAYWITDGNGKQFRRPADTVVRIYFPDPEQPWRSEGYLGPSAIGLDAYKFAGEHLRKHYQHDATPKVVLEGDKEAMKPPSVDSPSYTRFVRQWIESYAGRSRGESGGVPRFLLPGYKAHQLDSGAGESTKAYLDFWRECLMMEVGGVPPAILGRVVSGDRSSAETVQWIFDMYSVLPVACLIEDAMTNQLAVDYDLNVRVRFAPFISTDKEFELKREAHDLEHALRTPNKVLTDREDDEVDWGKSPLISGKLKKYDPDAPTPLQQNTGGNQVDPADDSMDGEDDADRIARSIHTQVRKLHRVKKRRGRAA